MVGIIKLFKNITSMVNVQEFRKRFISTTILSFLFLSLILFKLLLLIFLTSNPIILNSYFIIISNKFNDDLSYENIERQKTLRFGKIPSRFSQNSQGRRCYGPWPHSI